MPKIYATVRVKSRILSRVIYSASQGGGGVALQDGSGTTFNVNKVDLGGVTAADVTIQKQDIAGTFGSFNINMIDTSGDNG